jgi:hypothetical protein
LVSTDRHLEYLQQLQQLVCLCGQRRDRRGLEKMREPQSSSLESAKGMPLSGPRNADEDHLHSLLMDTVQSF